MSDAFERFLKSNFFGNPYDAWHDGLDTAALTALHDDDLAKAEAILLKALPDHRAVVGLGEIRSEKAIKPLRKLLNDKGVATEVAVALFRISGDTSGIDAPIKALKDQRGHWSGRMDAAIALRNFRTEQAVNALLDALDDPEGLVRHHAASSLLVMYGRRHEAGGQDSTSLAIRIMRENERAEAAAAVRGIVNEGKLDGG